MNRRRPRPQPFADANADALAANATLLLLRGLNVLLAEAERTQQTAAIPILAAARADLAAWAAEQPVQAVRADACIPNHLYADSPFCG